MSDIIVKGARNHNLKNISINLPRHKLIVITGLSGSGKSSLAFDTIYAEGQRRYVESLSAYARQFLELMAKPDVDSIEGLSPAIAIDQKTTSRNPRSTVGTVTEIYDYLRLLFARVGVPTSPATGLPITSQTVSQMVDSILAFPKGQKILLLSPIVRGRKGTYKKDFLELRQRGFLRVQVNGTLHQLDTIPSLDKHKKHDIEVVVDRLTTSPDIEERLVDSIETALKLSDGLLFVQNFETKEQHLYSERFACPVSGFTLEEIEPRLFSFNSPFGACPTCDGLGTVMGFDPDLVIADKNLSIRDGALAPLRPIMTRKDTRILEFLFEKYGGDIHLPFREIPENLQHIILYGSEDAITFTFQDDLGREREYTQLFRGLIPLLEERFSKSRDNEYVQAFTRPQACKACLGQRLNKEALCVKIDTKSISDITAYSVTDCLAWIDKAPNFLSSQQQEIAYRILREVTERLTFLDRIGLGYLSLSRMSRTLSGGENQRIRLASQIGSGLTGVLYVLDEPSIGLHQRDNARLIKTLLRLRDLGNTVIVVEHDKDTISHADFIVDIGPRAGIHGGEIVAKGSLATIKKCKKSLTGLYLSGKKDIKNPSVRRISPAKSSSHHQKLPKNIPHITINKAHGHNLQHVTTHIPLRVMTAITGVSGSGKSTLINQTLLPALNNLVNGNHHFVLPHESITGIETLNKIVEIDQSPIGRTPRSNPATYTGLFTLIREWFASLPEAKVRGYTPSRFSFNVKGGRCEKCRGDGLIKIEMHFLPEVYVTCDECQGKRYNRETLQILYKHQYSISNILNMTVDEALSLFKAMPEIRRKLEALFSVGLGYIKLGQQATTLSGGEAQRIKLSRELGKRATGDTIYLLDEPTTGLHFDDINMLLKVLHNLVNEGNTVIVVEHNLDVIKNADWVLDLGPESGHNGGHIIASGTPEHLAKCKQSFTGQFLKPLLSPKK